MSKVFNIVVNKGENPKDVFLKEVTQGDPITLDTGIRVLLGPDFITREEPFIIETTFSELGPIKIVVERIYNPNSILMRFGGYIEYNFTFEDVTQTIQLPMIGRIEGAEETFTGVFYLSK